MTKKELFLKHPYVSIVDSTLKFNLDPEIRWGYGFEYFPLSIRFSNLISGSFFAVYFVLFIFVFHLVRHSHKMRVAIGARIWMYLNLTMVWKSIYSSSHQYRIFGLLPKEWTRLTVLLTVKLRSFDGEGIGFFVITGGIHSL